MTDLDHHGLTTADLNHRIWMIIGIHWPHRISNKMVYHRCPYSPMSDGVQSAT